MNNEKKILGAEACCLSGRILMAEENILNLKATGYYLFLKNDSERGLGVICIINIIKNCMT